MERLRADQGAPELAHGALPQVRPLSEQQLVLVLRRALEAFRAVRADNVAPAFGFPKNFPFDDQAELERQIAESLAGAQNGADD